MGHGLPMAMLNNQRVIHPQRFTSLTLQVTGQDLSHRVLNFDFQILRETQWGGSSRPLKKRWMRHQT